MKVIFVNYGTFDSNSGSHVANFANHLSDAGHVVGVFADGPLEGADDFGPRRFTALPRALLDQDIQAALAFDGVAAAPDDTIVHAWTPREIVRRPVEKLAGLGLKYVVHLEDNEQVISSAGLNRDWPALSAMRMLDLDAVVPLSLSHPLRYPTFLARGAGVTAIVPPLLSFAPGDAATHVLPPGVDVGDFEKPLPPAERKALRESLGIGPKTKVLVYHGNMHAANAAEVFSLYVAVEILRRRGHDVVLVRTGRDYNDGFDVSYQKLRGVVSIELGFVPRAYLLKVLKLADLMIQPGRPDDFNLYRLPSKLPEFLALGKPVLLPRANLGLVLEDGVEAVVLDRGDATEIADKAGPLLNDAKRAKAIGAAGRAFVRDRMNWRANAEGLARFYQGILTR